MKTDIVNKILDELVQIDGVITLRKLASARRVAEYSCRLVLESARRLGIVEMAWYTTGNSKEIGFEITDDPYSIISDEDFTKMLAAVCKIERTSGFFWTRILEGDEAQLPETTQRDVTEAQSILAKFVEYQEEDRKVEKVPMVKKKRKPEAETYYDKFNVLIKMFASESTQKQISVISAADRLEMSVQTADVLMSVMYHFGILSSESYISHSPNRLYWRNPDNPIAKIPAKALFTVVADEIIYHRNFRGFSRIHRLDKIANALKIVSEFRGAMKITEYANFISATLDEAAIHVRLLVESYAAKPHTVDFVDPYSTSFTIDVHRCDFMESALPSMIALAKSLPPFGTEALESFAAKAVSVRRTKDVETQEYKTAPVGGGESVEPVDGRITYRVDFSGWLECIRKKHGTNSFATIDAINSYSASHPSALFCCTAAVAMGFLEVKLRPRLLVADSGTTGQVHWRLKSPNPSKPDELLARKYVSRLRGMQGGLRIGQLQEHLARKPESDYQRLVLELIGDNEVTDVSRVVEQERSLPVRSTTVVPCIVNQTQPLPRNKVYIFGSLGLKASPKVTSDISSQLTSRMIGGENPIILSVDTSNLVKYPNNNSREFKLRLGALIEGTEDGQVFVVHGATNYVHPLVELLKPRGKKVIICGTFNDSILLSEVQ